MVALTPAAALMPGGGSERLVRSELPSNALDEEEMHLVGETLSLLDRKKLLMGQLMIVAAEAEGKLREHGTAILDGIASGEIDGDGLQIDGDQLHPPQTRVEITAGQQRHFGQVCMARVHGHFAPVHGACAWRVCMVHGAYAWRVPSDP